MDVSSAAAAAEALSTLLDPFRLLMLGCGVLMGLFLGIVPGIGGLHLEGPHLAVTRKGAFLWF